MIDESKIKYLIVHCSDTPDNQNIDSTFIHKMHLSFGWDGIGYHKIILRNGSIENGRPEYWIGAHVKGLNKISLGVCLVGRTKFTDNQFKSLKTVLKGWKKKYTKAIILGHRDSTKTKKTCPNFDVKLWCKENLI
tara:strand:+ start:370 stop:774 length:405 start_codon:yes stop_codon:yes gene_type:complete